MFGAVNVPAQLLVMTVTDRTVPAHLLLLIAKLYCIPTHKLA
jgi:hypothetical protein